MNYSNQHGDADPTKWDLRFLNLAKHVSTWSKDPSTQVGAVIVRNKRVISLGYNGLPEGIKDNIDILNDRDKKLKMIIHGEINAILFANESLIGTTLYTYPFMPCSNCASIVIQKGIRRVVSLINDNPRWIEAFGLSEKNFTESGVCLELFHNDQLERENV